MDRLVCTSLSFSFLLICVDTPFSRLVSLYTHVLREIEV